MDERTRRCFELVADMHQRGPSNRTLRALRAELDAARAETEERLERINAKRAAKAAQGGK